MTRILTLITISLCLFSCKLIEEKHKPAIISEPKLVAILVDYHLAQGLASSYMLRQKFKNIKTVNLTDSVLAANGCTRALFDSTISYYSNDVDKFNHIYDKVLNELSKMQAKTKDAGKKPIQLKQKAKVILTMRKIAAPYIFPVSSRPIKNGIVVANDDGTIIDIIDSNGELIESAGVEYYNGAIVPGFINTHCHLELSFLEGKIKNIKGLTDFISNFIKLRDNKPSNLEEIIKNADKQMQVEGIIAVGDISNGSSSFKVKSESKIYYYTFAEVFNTNPSVAKEELEKGMILLSELRKFNLPGSIVPHAPYTMSNELMRLIKDEHSNKSGIYSIHNQEGAYENEMFISRSGKLFDFLRNGGMNLDSFQAYSKSSLLTLACHFPDNSNTLLIHNIYTSALDVEQINPLSKNIYWVLCPKSNMHIEQNLPDIEMLTKTKYPIALGTDSLASNSTLSILEEIKLLNANHPSINFETLLQWGTLNGARALNIDDKLGSIEKGKKPGINLITAFDFERMAPTIDSKINVLL